MQGALAACQKQQLHNLFVLSSTSTVGMGGKRVPKGNDVPPASAHALAADLWRCMQGVPAGDETASREALAGNTRWKAFLGSLERNGYFQVLFKYLLVHCLWCTMVLTY